MRFKDAHEIASWRLCSGCGACAYACREKKVRLEDVVDSGIRPFVDKGCSGCSDCVTVCPGIRTAHEKWEFDTFEELEKGFGPVIEVWEGHATDPSIRFSGSSGGVITALSLYCIEKEGMHGVLHAGADERQPWKNKTYLSTERMELAARTGSRYSPASPCDSLDRMESAPSRCVFIGKPCDVAGLRKAQALNRKLAEKTGLALAIFCAGTPSTKGTLDLLKKFSLDAKDLSDLRYRGEGWPGNWRALKKDGSSAGSLTYKEAWSFLQKYRPMRCHLCPDGTGEFADISCGDPWYRKIEPHEQGLSLVLARTSHGKRILAAAAEAGYVSIRKIEPELLVKSQQNLLRKRKDIWGRLLAMKLLNTPSPVLKGFSLFENWRTLTGYEKLKSVLGTARRIIKRKYYKRQVLANTRYTPANHQFEREGKR